MQRADKRKYHYVYKITRDDGRYYIGMHSTDNLDDGYFGSGKIITRSIKRHGKDRHTKEILKFLPSREELRKCEKQLITEELRADTKCMNIAPGGGGGFINELHRLKAQAAAIVATKKRIAQHGQPSAVLVCLRKNAFSKDNPGLNWTGRKHSEETKAKMRAAHAKRKQSNLPMVKL